MMNSDRAVLGVLVALILILTGVTTGAVSTAADAINVAGSDAELL